LSILVVGETAVFPIIPLTADLPAESIALGEHTNAVRIEAVRTSIKQSIPHPTLMENSMNQELVEFRNQIDEFMGHHPQSPLELDMGYEFNGLNYYDENESLVFEGEVERFGADEPLIEMETSTGSRQLYKRWGRFEFEVDGTKTGITIYSDPHGHNFFMPFRDSTSGNETYGAGRYMDNHRPGLTQLSDIRFAFDFNYAYNPYCAYNENFSCPLPPRENWLTVPIRAGEKNYK
jgi:uncharacterized protein (DUF1684 family)